VSLHEEDGPVSEAEPQPRYRRGLSNSRGVRFSSSLDRCREENMRCQIVAVCALSLAGLTGCPHDWVKEEGFFDRTEAKDNRERLETSECTEQARQALCPEGKPRSEECIKVCGK
jgi:hypothetical protein